MRPSAHPFRPPKGCRRTRSSIAVVPSFSIHLLLCSAGFHQPPRSYEEIRLLRGCRPVVVAFSGSTARADPRRPPWVSSLDVPPLPPPIPPRPRMDFGRRVSRHADPAGPACTEVHLRSVLRFASGFFPTRPHGASAAVSYDDEYCMQLPPARGCYHLAPRRTFTSNPVPMPGTPSRATPSRRRGSSGRIARTHFALRRNAPKTVAFMAVQTVQITRLTLRAHRLSSRRNRRDRDSACERLRSRAKPRAGRFDAN